MRSVSRGLWSLLLLVIPPCHVSAQAPRALSFHGVLTDAGGAPKADGPYTLTFRLYDALAGGAPLWTEADAAVSVAGGKGQFATLLGNPTPFNALAFDKPYFLEVEVSGDGAPMAPRLPLASVPYAMNASSGTATLSLPFVGSLATSDAAITLENTGSGGIGVRSITHSGRAFWGTTDGSYAVYAEAKTTGVGVQGISVSSAGVAGYTTTGVGVLAQSQGSGQGLRAISANRAVWATSTGASYGVYAESNTGIGVNGTSNTGAGVGGTSGSGYGAAGISSTNVGVYGESGSYEGVRGISHNANHGAVVAINTSNGAGLYAISQGGGLAGQFDGRVSVAVLEITGGADLAEKFDVSAAVEPGTVMAIDAANPGALCMAAGRYDRKVAGVISGANRLGAGMVLPDVSGAKGAQPLAMSGRVWVKCDASNGPIGPGDLLTTSDTPGHAMKVTDHARATGSTIGKAMSTLDSGDGLVLALVNLQ